MKRTFRWIAALFALAVLPPTLVAQERGTITGQVVDQATRQPLVGAQITIAGTQLGTLSNQQGRFLLPNVPAGTRDVRVTLIGYTQRTQTATVAAGETVTLSFELAQTAVAIEGVVVTATGEVQRRREMGNVVGNIAVQELDLAAIQNLSQALQARSPGVTVIQSSGVAGAGSRIRIRGSNSVNLQNAPVVIIDGVRVNDNPNSFGLFTGGQQVSRIDDLNPEDIENIEILKGPAAAAMYGTAAANGVIQITTRRGRAGTPLWRFSAESGSMTQRADFPDNWWGRGRNAAGTTVRCNNQDRASGLCVQLDTIFRHNPLRDVPEIELFRQGARQRYGLSVAGGTEQATYFLSGDWENETGVQVDNYLQGLNLRANITAQLRENLRFNGSTGYTDRRIQLPQGDASALGPMLNAMRGNPQPAFTDPDSPNYTGGLRAPLTPEMTTAWDQNQDAQRFIGSGNMNWQPQSWLSVTGVAGIDLLNRFDNSFVTPGILTPFGNPFAHGLREQWRVQVFNYTANLAATARRSLLPELESTTSIGTQYQRETLNSTWSAGENVPPGTRDTAEPRSVGEGFTDNVTVGGFLQQQFGWRDRVFFTGAVRGDQNSAFGQDLEWVWYPSASMSWVVSEEPFFPEVGFLNNLRLRGAWGQSGLRPGLRDALRYFQAEEAAIEGRGVVPGFIVAGVGLAGLRPEVATELELGFDLGIIDDRLGLEFTHYNKRSRDALIFRPLPPSAGSVTGLWQNLGSVRNTGVELLLRATPVRTADFGLELTSTISTNRNELLALGELRPGEPLPDIVFGNQRHRVGYPLGSYWIRPFTWVDHNDDGRIAADTLHIRLAPADSVVHAGNPFPTREMSFSGNLRVRDFLRVSGLLDFKGGHQMFNWTMINRCAGTAGVCREKHDPATPLEVQAAIAAWDMGGTTVAGPFVEDADFWRLREVAVTLIAPQQLVRRLGFRQEGVSLTLAGRNLGTWTNYSGFDPEVNSAGQANFTTDDYYTLPPPRLFTARIDINF
jgi:TonB-dependent starch-binding outer membrane protein SusC